MNTKKIYKRLPYGNSDFKSIITENDTCVDKKRYIYLQSSPLLPQVKYEWIFK
jgi:hypothetical protein